MVGRVQTFDRRLLTRGCVACGYDGALLRGGQAERCARCGIDLRLRPARSYAEMEGLLGQPVSMGSRRFAAVRQQRLVHRWLAFLLCSMLFIVLLGWLASSAFAV